MVIDELSLEEVMRLVEVANSRRASLDPSSANIDDSEVEQRLNAAFTTNNTLAVYGTLAPGRQNYHIVEPLGGEWTEGLIEGNLQETGWGATLGYPAFRPQAGGSLLKIFVLHSTALTDGWKHVDDFEGPDYQRILVPVFNIEDQELPAIKRRLYTVANLYAARDR